MPRERSPNRERAFEMWRDSNGQLALKDIAAAIGVSDSQVRNWKTQDQWVLDDGIVAQRNANRCATKRSGAPKGNRNAIGHGAPPRNSNANGNRGGSGGPPGNKKALKTGEYEAIWMDALDDDERELVGRMQTDPMVQLDEEITLLTIRERRMMVHIQRLSTGLTEKQKRVLQELRTVKEAVPIQTGGGSSATVVRDTERLIVTQIEEKDFRVIDDILRIEEALTRIQDKKLKAIDVKRRHENPDDDDTEDDGFLDALKGRGNEVWSDASNDTDYADPGCEEEPEA